MTLAVKRLMIMTMIMMMIMMVMIVKLSLTGETRLIVHEEK